jgi:hypothetical protein
MSSEFYDRELVDVGSRFLRTIDTIEYLYRREAIPLVEEAL